MCVSVCVCVCLVCCVISHSLINSIRTLAHPHSLTTSGTSPGRCLTSAATSPRPLPSRRLSRWCQPSAISSSTQTERYHIVYWEGGHTPCHLIQHPDREVPYSVLGGGGGGHTPCHLIQHPDREVPYSVLGGGGGHTPCHLIQHSD